MNTKNFREIEKKFICDVPYLKAAHVLTAMFSDFIPLICKTWDDYWPVPGKAQFVRLRRSKGRQGSETRTLDEITVKAKDRRSNVNRLELNLDVGEQPIVAEKLLKLACGESSTCVYKNEYVWFLPGSVVLSLCEVNKGKVYIEVEGPSLASIERIIRGIKKRFKPLKQEPKSLFELYVQPTLE